MIDPAPVQRLDTLVTNPLTGVQLHRTDYAGTVWYGGRPQVSGGMVISRGGGAQIGTPFWLPDSHAYDPAAAASAQIQASAAVQSTVEYAQIMEVSAALGEDPQGSGVLRVYVTVAGSSRIPLGVSYRVTVICPPEGVRQVA
jgi:hypothetical protein